MNRPLASILLLFAVASPVFAGRYKITGREEVSDGDGHRLILSVESKEPVTTDEAQAAAERIVDDLFRDRGLRAVELRFRTRDGAPDAAPEAVLRWAPADYPDSVTPQRPSDFAAYGLTVREGALLASGASPDTVAAPTTPPPHGDWGAAPAREHIGGASQTAEKAAVQAARVENSMANVESIASRAEVAAGKAETAANRVAEAIARLEALERERPANRGATDGGHRANELVLRFVREWKTAWESRNLAGYMAFYADDFQSGDMDRWTWAAHKHKVFAATNEIRVELDHIEEVEGASGRSQVTFVQTYKARGKTDRGIKTLTLVKGEDGKLKIAREEWSAR